MFHDTIDMYFMWIMHINASAINGASIWRSWLVGMPASCVVLAYLRLGRDMYGSPHLRTDVRDATAHHVNERILHLSLSHQTYSKTNATSHTG